MRPLFTVFCKQMILSFFASLTLSAVCPHNINHIYGSSVSAFLNKSQWYYFYTTLLQPNAPLLISAKANTTTDLYVHMGGNCPTRLSKKFMKSGKYRWAKKNLVSKKENEIVVLGAYAKTPTKLEIKVGVQDARRKRSTNKEIISTVLVFITAIVYVYRYMENQKKFLS